MTKITAEELGLQKAFPGAASNGMNLRAWFVGKALEGILAADRRPGPIELTDEINRYVDAVLTDLAGRMPEKKQIPIPKV